MSLSDSFHSCCCTRKCIESKWAPSKELLAVKSKQYHQQNESPKKHGTILITF